MLAVGALHVALFATTASAGTPAIFIGTDGDDYISGTDSPAGDRIVALGGRDTVDAGGSDLVRGGAGEDGGWTAPPSSATRPATGRIPPSTGTTP